MFKKVNLICVISLGMISLSALNIKSVRAETKVDSYIETASNYDAEAALYGVSIDKDLWDVRWNNNYDGIEANWDDDVYGITDTHIGEAFYKEKINGKYRTSLIYAIKTMPKNTYRTIHHQILWHGWDEDYLTIKNTILEGNNKLMFLYYGNKKFEKFMEYGIETTAPREDTLGILYGPSRYHSAIFYTTSDFESATQYPKLFEQNLSSIIVNNYLKEVIG